MVRVKYLLPHQLIAATNAQDGSPFTMSTNNSLRHPIAAELIQIGKRAFATGQNNYIRFRQFLGIVGIKKDVREGHVPTR